MPDDTRGERTIDGIGRRAFLGALGTGTALSFGVGSAASQDVTLLDSCTTITEPGTYRLTRDLEDSFVSDTGPEGEDAVDESEVCIEILASDVHFDGDGHTLTNPAERELGQVGVITSFDVAQSNVTIEDVTSVGGRPDSPTSTRPAEVSETSPPEATRSASRPSSPTARGSRTPPSKAGSAVSRCKWSTIRPSPA